MEQGSKTPEQKGYFDLQGENITEQFAKSPIYSKSALVRARIAEAGDVITTTLADGTVETTDTAKGGEIIVTNPGGEEYMTSFDNFNARYDATDQDDVYKDKGKIRAFKNPTGEAVTIMAPWGEEQHGDSDCIFATTFDPEHPDEISTDRYIIGKQEFLDTYSMMAEMPNPVTIATEIINGDDSQSKPAWKPTKEQLEQAFDQKPPKVRGKVSIEWKPDAEMKIVDLGGQKVPLGSLDFSDWQHWEIAPPDGGIDSHDLILDTDKVDAIVKQLNDPKSLIDKMPLKYRSAWIRHSKFLDSLPLAQRAKIKRQVKKEERESRKR